MSKVLVVDDEPAILTVLQRVLEADGYEVLTADNGARAVDLAVTAMPDLVILDLRLPDVDGIELTKILRRWLTAPILILSGFNDEARKVQALDTGADDYLQKPFGLAELRARVRALQRRTGDETASSVVRYGSVLIDLAAGSVHIDDQEARLTRTEWLLLEALVRNPGKLLTHRRVAADVWGDGYGDEMRQTLRGHVKSLRAKLGDNANEPAYIRTESGAGYRWIAQQQITDVIETPSVEGTPEQLATLHDLNNALTVLTFSLDSALGIVRGMPDEPALAELLDKLQRGLSAANRAQDLALGLLRPALEV
ncbi:MAG TPA: response regulator transcription factor [Nocardioidaceae bacterium]|nr:response regulator transcription factor [Nocardioidaceae bacterium]